MRPTTWGSMLWTIAPQAAVRRGSACYRYLDHTAVMMSLEYLILRILQGSWMRTIGDGKTKLFDPSHHQASPAIKYLKNPRNRLTPRSSSHYFSDLFLCFFELAFHGFYLLF
ncbi:MAG: hypothetical protein KGS49_09820 [Planctomycetes bacterium]|nr:hypothetical protein [Planctomycetota bacterium]